MVELVDEILKRKANEDALNCPNAFRKLHRLAHRVSLADTMGIAEKYT